MSPAVHNSRGGLRTAGGGNKTRSRKSMNGGLGMEQRQWDGNIVIRR